MRLMGTEGSSPPGVEAELDMPDDAVEVHCGPVHDWDALGGLRGVTHATSRHLKNNFAGAGSAS